MKGSSYAYAISPDGLLAYVADDRTNGSGGIQKWNRPDTASAFTLTTTWGTGATGADSGARGLAVDFSTIHPTIYASTTASTGGNRLITFSDVTNVQTGLTTIAASGAADIFRGVAFTPVPEPLLAFTLVPLAIVARRRFLSI